MIPPKPAARAERVSLLTYARAFRKDVLSAQPARLYGAKMAEFRTPFFHSFLVNDPPLWQLVLKERPRDFPKSDRIAEGLRPLLGDSVFVTNGATWERQRRIIDPAFAAARLGAVWPAMDDAAAAAVARLAPGADGRPVEIEEAASHAAADVIFRTLFSMPIETPLAAQVFALFREHQRSQPILNPAAFLRLPRWMPRPHRRRTRRTAAGIRSLVAALTAARRAEIEAGTAPDDLATAIMTTPDPETGAPFSDAEMTDQVAIFFLAGHETSASALSWALYLLAAFPDWQDRVADEVAAAAPIAFSTLSRLRLTRDVFRETLRLYPPVPMMVREAARAETFRGRTVPAGAQIVISPWHLHRHTALWAEPDAFDPGRWSRDEAAASARAAYLPFSAGPRVCIGAGFAMAEGVTLLARLVHAYRVAPVEDRVPVPVAHLTVRARDGIWLRLTPREGRVSGRA